MKLFVVTTPIGNLKDITIRAKEVLTTVKLILCEDTRVTSLLCSQMGFTGKLLSCHKFNETAVAEKLTELFSKYDEIAYVSDAGTPAISDPGAILVSMARKLGAEIEAVPGVSAVICAMSLAGETKGNGFTFLGFLPREKSKQKAEIERLFKAEIKTAVFYESPNRIIDTLSAIPKEYVQEVCVFNDLTKKFEKHYVGDVESVIKELKANENASKGEYVVVLKLSEYKAAEATKQSFESLIIDEVIKNNTTIKQAISNLTLKGYNKNNLYKAGLNLKNVVK